MEMRVFKNRWFTKFARRHRIGDDSLLDAVLLADQGLVDAELGGGVIKLRIGRKGEGKRAVFATCCFSERGTVVSSLMVLPRMSLTIFPS